MKKIFLIFAILFIIASLLCLSFVSCGDSDDDDDDNDDDAGTYTINFDANGGTGTMPDQIAASGETVNLLLNQFTRCGCTFSGWTTSQTGTVEYIDQDLYTMGSANVTLYAVWIYIDYSLRDTGPAGGLIFYDNPDYAADGWRYLEAAPSDQSSDIQWYNGSYITTGATGTAIGTGEDNTATILTSQGAGSYAAQICNDLSIGIYDDWFLPSKDELNAMHVNLHVEGVGGFAGDYYWSSSEDNVNSAWYQYFPLNNAQAAIYKFHVFSVRAVRAF